MSTPLHIRRASRPRLTSLGILLAGILLLSLAEAGPAFAGAWWRLNAREAPSVLVPGQKATIVVGATNVGDGGVDATSAPVIIKDTLPPDLEATEIRGGPAFNTEVAHLMTCNLSTLTCTSKSETFPAFERLEVIIAVNVKSGASTGEEANVSVQGGRQQGEPNVVVPSASLNDSLTVGGEPTQFGVEEAGYAVTPEEDGGAIDRRAGSHPFQLTTTLNLNQALENNRNSGPTESAPALARNLSFNLPPGLVGDPLAVAQCPTTDFLAISGSDTNACKPESAVGVAVVTLDEPNHFGDITRAVPLWNLEAAQGEPARLGFEVIKVPVVLDTAVRSGGDYGVSVSVRDAPQAAQILSSEVTIWGVPGEASHDQSRGWACILGGVWFEHEVPCSSTGQSTTSAFLTLPTSCTGPVATTVEGVSWPMKALASEPGEVFSLQGASTEGQLQGFEGCESLPFEPKLAAAPVQEAEEDRPESQTTSGDTPTGLRVNVEVPQKTTLEAGGLGEADVKSASVTLPEGVLLNPSAANGLQACSEQQVGFEGAPGVDPLSPGAPQPLKFSTAAATCPGASKVGMVHIKTPLLAEELTGAVYLATPAPSGELGMNPFNSLVALYVVAEDPSAGIRVKIAGESQLNASTGQITSTFTDTPQVPFEDLAIQLFGGPRASVSTPALCGGYSAGASFAPWSGAAAVPVSSPAAEFQISSGAGGAACASPLPLTPGFQAGSTNDQAGAFTSFTLSMSRPDGDQTIKTLAVRLPPGSAALVASVPRCPEPQASLGTCGPESEIGKASATSGLGPDPFTVTGGRVYLTGPYEGAPFGLSIVTPAVAGPFNLGNVVVRSTINVDSSTAAVTISSALPSFVQGVGMPASGVPLQLQRIDVTVDRPGFEFNPTNCSPMSINATIAGDAGGVANVSSPFQVANCAALPFKPTLEAITQGKASKNGGASLVVKVTSNKGQANIAKTSLQLPIQMPSRLSTIQQACDDSLFDANPASCPEGSNIGTATVHTPVLNNPLTGPAFLVSHGNREFPDVEFVLQGEGITLILDGQIHIEHGVTTSTFETVPDAPVTSFEANLPEGPHSALGAFIKSKEKYNFCPISLLMPTVITGQNGAIIEQTTKIKVSGCAKPFTKAQKLAKALKVCATSFKRNKAKRHTCERTARKAFTAKKTRAKKGSGNRKSPKGTKAAMGKTTAKGKHFR